MSSSPESGTARGNVQKPWLSHPRPPASLISRVAVVTRTWRGWCPTSPVVEGAVYRLRVMSWIMITIPSRMPMSQLPITQPMAIPNTRAAVPMATGERVFEGGVSIAKIISKRTSVRAISRTYLCPCLHGGCQPPHPSKRFPWKPVRTCLNRDTIGEKSLAPTHVFGRIYLHESGDRQGDTHERCEIHASLDWNGQKPLASYERGKGLLVVVYQCGRAAQSRHRGNG